MSLEEWIDSICNSNSILRSSSIPHILEAILEKDLDPNLIGEDWSFIATTPKDQLFEEAQCIWEKNPESASHRAIDAIAELFYATSRPARFELLTHMSAREGFLIDLDALFIEALGQSLVRHDLVQPLHVCYILERQLQSLMELGGRFHIVSFRSQCNTWFCPRVPAKFAAMRVMIEHRMQIIALNNTDMEFVCFDHWASKKYSDFVANYRPEFILLTDAEALTGKKSLLRDCPLAADIQRLHWLHLLYTLGTYRLHIVFASNLFYKDNDVLAFVIRCSSERFVPAGRLTKNILDRADNINEQVQTSLKENASDPFENTHEMESILDRIFEAAVKDHTRCKAMRTRDIISLAALSQLAESHTTMVALHILTLCVTSVAPSNLRLLPPFCSDELSNYLEVFSKEFMRAMVVRDQFVLMDEKLVDYVDGNLMATILHLIQRHGTDISSLLSPNMTEHAEWMFGLVAPASGKTNFVQRAWSALMSSSIQVTQEPLRHHPYNSSAFDSSEHPLVQALANFANTTPNLELPVTAKQTPSLLWVPEQSLFDLDTPPGVVQHARLRAILHKLTKQERRRFNRYETDYLNAINRIAESLGVEPYELTMTSNIKEVKRSGGSAKAGEIQRRNRLERVHEALQALVKQTNNKLQELTTRSLDSSVMLDELFVLGSTIIKKHDDVLLKHLKGSETSFLLSKEGWNVLTNGHVFRDLFGTYEVSSPTGGIVVFATRELDKCMSDRGKRPPLAKLTASELQIAARTSYAHYFFLYLVYRIHAAAVLLIDREWTRHEVARALRDDDPPNLSLAVPLFRAVQGLYNFLEKESEVPDVHPGLRTRVLTAVSHLGFSPEYNTLFYEVDRKAFPDHTQPLDKQCLHWSRAPRHLPHDHNSVTFQLRIMGHLLPRPTSGLKDPRVPFSPDPWQTELLDVVDRRASAIVCAPTSAGKTFISYYCMKRVLTESETGIVAYICPTRALINQAMADVYGRYGHKKYDSTMRVVGCLGGAAYVRAPFQCQVLVTLPETLESLLLSSRHQAWASRIKYVIFDEIHSIENSGNGNVWERLLALVRAPFVALSATLGESQDILQWLNRIQATQATQMGSSEEVREFKVHLIPRCGTIQRWSDIQTHIYLPIQEENDPVRKELNKDGDSALSPFHPLSALSPSMARNKFPPQISLVPSETLDVYHQMIAQYGACDLEEYVNTSKLVSHLEQRLIELSPEEYFRNVREISQTQARAYESAVKALMQLWGTLARIVDAPRKKRLGLARKILSILTKQLDAGQESSNSDSNNQVASTNDVHGWFNEASIYERYQLERLTTARDALEHDLANRNTLSAGLLAVCGAARYSIDALLEHFRGQTESRERQVETAAKNGAFPDTTRYVHQHIHSLLKTLQRREMLPSLVFSFEESACESLVSHLVKLLEDAEAVYRASREFKKWENAMRQKAQRQQQIQMRQARGVSAVKEVNEKGKIETRQDEVVEADPDADYSIPDILPQFSFGTISDSLGELKYDFRSDKLAWRALQRGIGIHTPAVRGKLRLHIERLFRRRTLPVVFATEGLALGINSPCRSVVLAGDHIRLNTSQFRQMSGRAGRRGQDFIGHLILLGVGVAKIRRLFTSGLPSLRGHVHIDPMTELRLLQLYNESRSPEEAEHVRHLAECCFVKPLFWRGRRACPVYQHFMVHHISAIHSIAMKYGLLGSMRSFDEGDVEELSSEEGSDAEDEYFRQGFEEVATADRGHTGKRKHLKPSLAHAATAGSLTTRVLQTYCEVNTGNAGFLLAILFQSGVMERLLSHNKLNSNMDLTNLVGTQKADNLKKQLAIASEDFLHLLSVVFTRETQHGIPLDLHPSVLRDRVVFQSSDTKLTPRAFVPHNIIHTPLRELCNEEFSEIYHKSTREILHLLTASLAQMVSSLPEASLSKDAALSLPLSHRHPFGSGKPEDHPILMELSTKAFTPLVRAPLSALCGRGDDFTSVFDLLHSLRSGLFVDPSHIPTIDLEELLLNACVTDWLQVGSQVVDGMTRREHLETFNGLAQDTSWHTLKHFALILDNLFTVREQVLQSPAASQILGNACEMVSRRHDEIAFRSALKPMDLVPVSRKTKTKRPALARPQRR